MVGDGQDISPGAVFLEPLFISLGRLMGVESPIWLLDSYSVPDWGG